MLQNKGVPQKTPRPIQRRGDVPSVYPDVGCKQQSGVNKSEVTQSLLEIISTHPVQ